MSDFREGSDVARLNDRWRVIDSRERYPYRQWILQQRVRSDPASAREGKTLLQTREAVLRAIREKVGSDIGEGAHHALSVLPDRDMGIQTPKEVAI
jgi:hypothetical protein